ncbi:MAG: bifunctional (p)ppGpp synthetase/guanosine-3',5'-bis(diphosphate) 3'-pyrophosphohydrolase [Clostridiales bacterium]|nr:bifunctional (p)ppGpp synthetase/guanosine-3',5'-bis(diphosphate) 3'-pyrophosphohydrolase [Clostridiales bacterium]
MSKYSNVAHYQDFSELEKILENSSNTVDTDKIRRAYKFAEKSHGDQKRVSGIPYILHPTSVACIVAELGMDTDTICGALLHDVVEDTPVTLEEISKTFGEDVAKLIDGVTKISKIPFSSREQQQAENIRKMLIAMADDIRVIIIKLGDRLHNMRTMDCMPEQKRRDKSLENMQVFAPIAHRLGIKTVKDELEDRSLQYLDPVGYKEIEDALLMTEEGRDKFIESIKEQILDKTEGSIPNAYISGRVKSINSIYRKTFMQGRTIDQIFDVFAVRVIVDNVSDCYNVLGVVHDIFKPIPNRFKDYISMPKPNMYQSLHTTVLDKNAIPFEVQIRTWEMHYTAEYGIAAHWKYKLGMNNSDKNGEDRLSENIQSVKKMILDQLETEDVTDIAKNIRNDFTENEVYVFTPKGDVINLPHGSTPIDLAYIIHTQVGHRMVGAKVNGKIVPIDYKLKTGEICEIITQKEEHPNKAWIDICKTASAKSKIRQWYKHEKRDENILEGKQMLEREFKRQGINLTEEESEDFFRRMLLKKQYNNMDDFYAAVGYGGVQLWKIMPRIKEEYQKEFASNIEEIDVPQAPAKRHRATSGVVIEGADDVLVKFSNCCNPLPGDDIIGYITRGYGVSIHKRSCTNVPEDISKSEEPERWISCYWEDEVGEAFRSTLQIKATDRTGLLADVTIKLSNMHIFIHSLNSRETGDGKAIVTATIDVMGKNHLRGVLSKLSDINGIEEIKRV